MSAPYKNWGNAIDEVQSEREVYTTTRTCCMSKSTSISEITATTVLNDRKSQESSKRHHSRCQIGKPYYRVQTQVKT